MTGQDTDMWVSNTTGKGHTEFYNVAMMERISVGEQDGNWYVFMTPAAPHTYRVDIPYSSAESASQAAMDLVYEDLYMFDPSVSSADKAAFGTADPRANSQAERHQLRLDRRDDHRKQFEQHQSFLGARQGAGGKGGSAEPERM
jgi:hypothetical protein